MKKNILILIFIFVFLAAKDSWACWTDSADAYCCSDNYCSGCTDQNDCDRYSWSVWQYSYVEVHEYNSSTCCPTYTCATNGYYCTSTSNSDPRAIAASGTCPSGQKCIKCAPNVTCTTSNVGQQVTAGGTINSDGSGCNPLKTCPSIPFCTCDWVTASTVCTGDTFSQTGSGCTTTTCDGTKSCAANTCASCTALSGKGWCDGSCKSGTSAGPLSGSCSSWAWTSNQCPVKSKCPSCVWEGGTLPDGTYCPANVVYGDKEGWVCEINGGSSCGTGQWMNYCSPRDCSKCYYSESEPDNANDAGWYTHLWGPSCSIPCCSPVDGLPGVCGTAAGQTTVLPPPSSNPYTTLCSTGTPTTVLSVGTTTFKWDCNGTAGNSCGSYGSSVPCTSIKNSPPVYVSTQLKNSVGTIVPAESGNRNHLCQTDFASDKVVKFLITVSDPNGVSDLSSVKLRLGGSIYNTVAGGFVNGVGTFIINSINLPPAGTYNIEVWAIDKKGAILDWFNTGRSFKIWDCSVPVIGTLYDGSLAVFEVISCADGSADFANPVEPSVEYLLNFKGTLLDTSNKSMTVNSPSYTSNGNSLYWGAQYKSEFTNVTGGIPMYKRPGSVATCNSANTPFVIDNVNVDPYVANPTLTVNYSVILNHFPWYQTAGGGIVAKESITDSVPDSCLDPCVSSISIDSILSQSGLIAAETITKGAYGTYSETNDWHVAKDIFSSNYSYKYFYNEYFAKLNQGKVYNVDTSMSQILLGTGGTGVVFVNGNVAVDVGNTVPVGKFFMLITSNDINVDSNVTQMQGVFITDNVFSSIGVGDSQLRIDGSIYSKKDVSLTRDFTVKTYNNRNPAILVTNRPDFIFSMPGKLTKILMKWKEGI